MNQTKNLFAEKRGVRDLQARRYKKGRTYDGKTGFL
jgi:hypothetical protein